MMSRTYGMLLLALAALASHGAVASTQAATGAGSPASVSPATVGLPGTYEQILRSRTGLEYRIFVSEPAAPPPPGGYPVVYVLDGNAWFVHASQLVRIQGSGRPDKSGVVPAVVVGVGYPGDVHINSPRRTWDYTPDVPLREPNPASWVPTGGADAFIAFLEEELKPEIARRFAVDPDREILFGHSLGGLFALHAYFRHNDSFDAVVAASPSTWWNDDLMLREAEAFAAAHASVAPDSGLLIAMGSDELPFMVSGPRQVFQTLAPLAANGAPIALAELEGDDHLSAAPVALTRLAKRFLAPTVDDIEHYLAMVPPERQRPAAGHGLIESVRELASADGAQVYTVREYIPAGVIPLSVQRTIYVLEGGEVLEAALRAANAATRGTAVVAVSHRDGSRLDEASFKPTRTSAPEERGGAEALQRFLLQRLIPTIVEEGGRGRGDSVLVGSERAGLFALYAAANEPSTAGAYVVLDPSTDWPRRMILNNNVIGRIAPKLASRQQSTRISLLTGGEAPETTRLLVDKLDAFDGVSLRFEQGAADRVQALADAIETAFASRADMVPAQPRVFTRETGLPVLSADDYAALTAQERFDGRMAVRGLDRELQQAWSERFKFVMDAGLWYYDHRLLHEEKERMDEINGYVPAQP